jgi:hypothetical protein
MSASLQKFSDDRKIDPSHEGTINCPYSAQASANPFATSRKR